jgi:hypothetical protein
LGHELAALHLFNRQLAALAKYGRANDAYNGIERSLFCDHESGDDPFDEIAELAAHATGPHPTTAGDDESEGEEDEGDEE